MERDAKDYAIEFGGYLAMRAEQLITTHNDPNASRDDKTEAHSALLSAIYEFRKRAAKVAAVQPT